MEFTELLARNKKEETEKPVTSPAGKEQYWGKNNTEKKNNTEEKKTILRELTFLHFFPL